MSVDFRPIIPDPAPTPARGNYTDLQPFRFWCQKVLPLVYDESLSYYELLCKVVDYLNKTMEDVGVLNDDIGTLYDAFTSLTGWTEDQVEALLTAYSELQDYVNNYFDNLNVQTEINNKLDALVTDGTMSQLVAPFIPDQVAAWLSSHVDPSTGYVVDTTLSIAGAAADAKATGDAITKESENASQTAENLSDILFNGILTDKDFSYKRGGVDLDTGEYISGSGISDYYMVNTDFRKIKLLSDTVNVTVAEGYMIRGVIFDPEGTYLSSFSVTWSTGGYINDLQYKKDHYIIAEIGKVNEEALTNEEVAAAGPDTLLLTFEYNIQNGLLDYAQYDANKQIDITNENINKLMFNGYMFAQQPKYKRGGINLLTGEYAPSLGAMQMVNQNFEKIKLLSDSVNVVVKEGLKTRGVIFNPDGTYNNYFALTWSTGGYIPELQDKNGYYVIFTLENTNDSPLTDEEVFYAGSDTITVEFRFDFQGGLINAVETAAELAKPFEGKNVVNFGDSIFGNFRDTNTTTDKSISKMLEERLGGSWLNAGFGGCNMGYHSEYWRAFSMYSLAAAIASNDWTEQDAAIAAQVVGMPDYFSDTLTALKAVDWSEIDYITIAYGTNDYALNAWIDSRAGLEEYQYFKGALDLSLRTLLAAYPHIRVVVITPCWRWFPDATTGLLDYDSDDVQSKNTRDYILPDYVDACISVCKDNHVPVIDDYYNLGFNQYSYTAYFHVKGVAGAVASDGTHPKQYGRQLLADHIAGQLLSFYD